VLQRTIANLARDLHVVFTEVVFQNICWYARLLVADSPWPKRPGWKAKGARYSPEVGCSYHWKSWVKIKDKQFWTYLCGKSLKRIYSEACI